MGLEGCNSQYAKLQGIDTFELVRELQSHGIRVLGSTIIGLENHTPENIDAAIDYAVRHDTDFHQFMLYTPIPGTPLHAELTAKGVMKDESEFDPADIHGQSIFNYRHPHIPDGQEAEFMLRAFDRDFERNGPSTLRIVRTTLAGWKRYKNHPGRPRPPPVRLGGPGAGHHLLGRRGRREALLPQQPGDAREDVGPARRVEAGVRLEVAALRGRGRAATCCGSSARRRSGWPRGWTYEPPTFYEKNEHCPDQGRAAACRLVAPRVARPPRPSWAKRPAKRPGYSFRQRFKGWAVEGVRPDFLAVGDGGHFRLQAADFLAGA